MELGSVDGSIAEFRRDAESTNTSLYPSMQNENNLLGNRSTVLFDTNSRYLPISGNKFVAKQFFAVTRSIASRFSNYGTPFGSQDGNRVVLYENNQTYFHFNQYPRSLKRNTVAKSGNFNISPIDEFMILNIQSASNKENTLRNYHINRQDSYSNTNEIAEIMVFDRHLTTFEENIITAYLANKWGFSDTIDSDGDGVMDADDLTVGDFYLNRPPVLEAPTLSLIYENEPFTINLSATDADGDTITYELVQPIYVNLVDNGDGTATISGTPLSSHAGQDQIVIKLLDGIFSESTTINIDILSTQNDAPTSISVESTTISRPVNPYGLVTHLSTDDVDGPETVFSLASGNGDTDNNDFVIYGTSLFSKEAITAIGTKSVRIKVSDGEYEYEDSFVFDVTLTDDSDDTSDGTGTGGGSSGAPGTDFDKQNITDLSDYVAYALTRSENVSDIESNLVLWLDASNIDAQGNASMSPNSKFSTWKDLSGNNNNAVQNNGSYQAQYKIQDGHEGVDFTSDDYIVNGVNLYSLGHGNGKEFTVFAVIKPDSYNHGKFIGTDNGGYDRTYGRDNRAW